MKTLLYSLTLTLVLTLIDDVIASGHVITDTNTGKQYVVSAAHSHSENYHDSQATCNAIGGRLPEPRNAMENDFLDTLTTKSFYLGMSDRVTEGAWVWESDGSAVSWANWVVWTNGWPAAPNGGTRENCGLMLKDYYTSTPGHSTKAWADKFCDRAPVSNMSLICEIESHHGETSPETACLPRPNSKRREIVTLSDGRDVMCDTETDGGNWIVFQRRTSSDIDFYLGWDNYTAGFGDLSTNFWLGLDNIYSFCPETATCELRVDFEYQGNNYYATYQDFFIEGPSQNFKLHVGQYSGNAGNALIMPHIGGNGHEFSTKDRVNSFSQSCPDRYHGAWWYNLCHSAHLNGVWGSTEYGKGLSWFPTTGHFDSVNFVEMKLRMYNE